MKLTTKQLRAEYQGKRVLHDIDLDIASGQVVAIVGANGCGKSTLLRCLSRLHRPSGGTVQLDGVDLWKSSSAETARRIALLPQLPQAPAGLTVAALAGFGRHPYQSVFRQWSYEDEQAVEKALADTDMLELAERPLEQLSGGQRQRAWLAMVLAQSTPLLLLDEPTSALDLGHQVDVLELLRSLAEDGRTVVTVLHDLAAAARYADKLIALDRGRVIAVGHPRDIVTPKLVRQLYGIEAHILRSPDDGAPVVVPAAAKRAVHHRSESKDRSPALDGTTRPTAL